MKKVEIKIAYIGGGSREWAPKIMSDLALCPNLTGKLSLYDINYDAAEANVEVGESIFDHPDSQTTFSVEAFNTMEDALTGADFVVLSIEPGPMTLRYADLEIPRAYGVYQPVGDTTGPGGLMRALRAVPIYEEYARRIMLHCPKAWVINYTNPLTLCTATLYRTEPSIKAFGCCHEVFSTQEHLAQWAVDWLSIEKPKRQEIHLDLAGINHFTFATAASYNGTDLFPYLKKMIAEEGFFSDRTQAALERKKNQRWFDHDSLIACDFLSHFGVLGAAGDRHLTEFVPWYLQDEVSLHRWGVVLTPYSWRVERVKDFSRRKPDAPLTPSGEEGVEQMQALLGLKPLVTNVNILNRGQISDLPVGAVVETYAQFKQDEIRPVVSKQLPPMLESIVRHIVNEQQTILRAAITRDRELAFQALLGDALMRIPTYKAYAMFGEMLDYVKHHFPAFEM